MKLFIFTIGFVKPVNIRLEKELCSEGFVQKACSGVLIRHNKGLFRSAHTS